MQGIIIRGVGSFYYVMNSETKQIIQCRAKGIFRSKKIIPTVGDIVLYDDSDQGDGIIQEILPRKSYLLRPMVANASQGVIVCAIKSPDISTVLLDKMLVNNAAAGLNSLICFNKADLASDHEIQMLTDIYIHCGAQILFTSVKTKEGIPALSDLLRNQISVFSGVSGAGKSSLLKEFFSDLRIETGAISEKLGRGKHTTRHSELMIFPQGGYIMDTPGFSDLELSFDPDELWKYYPEFYPYSDCKYSNCLHLKEPGCNVKSAVQSGNIRTERYENYCTIYKEMKKTYRKF